MLNFILLQGQSWNGNLMIGIVLIFAVMYFLMIRPQSKQEKQRKALINQLKKGDKILLNAGIYGTVIQAKEGQDVITISVSSETHIKINRSAVGQIVAQKKSNQKRQLQRSKK